MTDTPMISQGKKRPDDETTDADHMNYAHYMKNDHRQMLIIRQMVAT